MDIKTDQISIDYFNHKRNFNSGMNFMMFLEDLVVSKYSIQDRLVINIESKEEDDIINFIQNKFRMFIQMNNWRNDSDLNRIIGSLVSDIFTVIAQNGHCVLEKIFEEDSENLIGVKLVLGNTIIKRKKIFQLLPNEIAEKNELESRVIIPKSKCYIIEFPNEICTKKEYLSILKEFTVIDNKNPIHSILHQSTLSQVPGYNVMAHRKKLDLILRKLSKKTSWDHRDNLNYDKFSNYYTILRGLKFRRTKLILLYHIFDFFKYIIEDIYENSIVTLSIDKTKDEIESYIKEYEDGNFSQELHMKIINEFSGI